MAVPQIQNGSQAGALGTWHSGARGWAEIPKLLRRLCPTWLPASPVFGQKLVCGQEKCGTWTRFGMGGERGYFGLQPVQGAVPGQVQGCHHSQWLWGRNPRCALFTAQDVAFSWQGHSRVENVRVFGFCSSWACCICVPPRITALENIATARKAREAANPHTGFVLNKITYLLIASLNSSPVSLRHYTSAKSYVVGFLKCFCCFP